MGVRVVFVPLCVCWLEAAVMSHRLWPVVSSVPGPHPGKYTKHLVEKTERNTAKKTPKKTLSFTSWIFFIFLFCCGETLYMKHFTFTMGTYSSGGAGWILLDISITALTKPVTFSYTLSLERSRLAVGGGLISWGCSCRWEENSNKSLRAEV